MFLWQKSCLDRGLSNLSIATALPAISSGEVPGPLCMLESSCLLFEDQLVKVVSLIFTFGIQGLGQEYRGKESSK